MSDGTLFKAEKDFTKDADALIPEAQELAKVCLQFAASWYSADTNAIRYLYLDQCPWRY